MIQTDQGFSIVEGVFTRSDMARVLEGLSRAVKPMPIKNAVSNVGDDLRAEYDLSKLEGGVRGKYYERATAGTTFVLLEPDVAEAFPDGRMVNQALRALIKIAESRVRGTRSDEKLANRPSRPPSRAKGSTKKRLRPRAARG